ncbi:phosphate acetyltransferase [Luedemannella flava]|uniref:Phosphate acetyltransferase n=1 Tax=Luedemannella flava TaxID=349316 RepID=A0ABN2LGU8_9ACTN
MARSVYLTGLEPGGGKSTVALGVAELLSRRVRRLAVFRPVVGGADDPIVALLRDRYQLTDAGYGLTYAEAAALHSQGQPDQILGRIIDRYHAVTDDADAVIVVGSDFGVGPDDPGLPEELAMNARLANEFEAVVIGIVDGCNRTAEAVAGAVRSAYHSLGELGTTVVAMIANRTIPRDRFAILEEAPLPVPVYVLPANAAISAPTVAEVADALGARRLLGDDAAYSRDALRFIVGAAHVPVFLSHLADGGVVITPGDRDDLVTATFAAHASGSVSVAGVVLTLGETPDQRVLDVVGRLRTDLPVLSVEHDSFTTVAALDNLRGQLSAHTPRKIEAALGLFESHVDTRELSRRLDVARSARVTPLMFEYALIERARRDPRHVVLPEGTEDRILRAAEVVLRRGVARLTLLGPPEEITRRARELGLDVTAAELVDPATSSWRDEFAAEYAKLRAHRGVTLDAAHDTVSDVNYFGTLMVHTGRADAMVSGATHPTADTIRPAFEIIKVVPGLSVSSSVFFMCLADHVLVYGDCAINPDPTAEQLADIALSSAQTAARFMVEPKVAMLSYSTGTSGHGADVDKVVAATKLIRERAPELLVEGPIQYDAAVDPAVAATKLPGSPVAGQATVLIFPDLNTGNNTYKAVQRSAGAVAVGPVLQGLRKPVNDLSRGATVPDIINTIAITAIQAQG